MLTWHLEVGVWGGYIQVNERDLVWILEDAKNFLADVSGKIVLVENLMDHKFPRH